MQTLSYKLAKKTIVDKRNEYFMLKRVGFTLMAKLIKL